MRGPGATPPSVGTLVVGQGSSITNSMSADWCGIASPISRIPLAGGAGPGGIPRTNGSSKTCLGFALSMRICGMRSKHAKARFAQAIASPRREPPPSGSAGVRATCSLVSSFVGSAAVLTLRSGAIILPARLHVAVGLVLTGKASVVALSN